MRELRRAGVLLLGGLLLLQAGGGTATSRAVEQINAASLRPVPTVGRPPIARPDSVWVPDRWIPVPTGGVALVPGHVERRISEHQFYVPPLTSFNPADGRRTVYPADVRPPAAERREP